MILVTGATGLLGSHIVQNLLKANIAVSAIQRPNTNKKLLAHVANKINWITADILDVSSLDQAFKDCDTVIHAAAMVSFHPAHQDLLFKTNVEGTANVVNACLSNNIKKLVYISSVAALGRPENSETFIDEQIEWQDSKHNSNYAVSKMLAEREVWRGIAEGLPAVILNPTIILGKGDWLQNTANFFKKIDDGLKFYTSGSNGFVGAQDVANIVQLILEKNISNQRFLISENNYPYKFIFDEIASSINKPKPSVLATPLMSEIAWRVEKLKCFFTNKYPLITKETAHSANNKVYYDNTLIKQTLQYNFTPIQEVIHQIGATYLNEK